MNFNRLYTWEISNLLQLLQGSPRAPFGGESSWCRVHETCSCTRERHSGTPDHCCGFPGVYAGRSDSYSYKEQAEESFGARLRWWSQTARTRWGEDETPVFTILAAVRPLVAVAELDVAAQGRRWRACHVTQRAFVVAHCYNTWNTTYSQDEKLNIPSSKT